MTRRRVWRLFFWRSSTDATGVSLSNIHSRLLKYLKARRPTHSIVGTYKPPPLWFFLDDEIELFLSPILSTMQHFGVRRRGVWHVDSNRFCWQVVPYSWTLSSSWLHPLVSMISPTFLALHTILHIVRHDQLGRLCFKLCRHGNSELTPNL
jgi:hypothetical protein